MMTSHIYEEIRDSKHSVAADWPKSIVTDILEEEKRHQRKCELHRDYYSDSVPPWKKARQDPRSYGDRHYGRTSADYRRFR